MFILLLLYFILQDKEDIVELLCEEDPCLLEDDKLHLTDEQTPLLRLYTFFLLMFQSVFRVSDNAMNVLLLFFSMFFSTLSTIAMIPKAFILNLPKNVRSARNVAGSTRSSLKKFVCCPSCHYLYKVEECIIKNSSGELVSQRCIFKKFPNHPQVQHAVYATRF